MPDGAVCVKSGKVELVGSPNAQLDPRKQNCRPPSVAAVRILTFIIMEIIWGLYRNTPTQLHW